MSFHITTRWGGDEREPSEPRLAEVLAELDVEDPEHCSVSLTHESEWSLGVYPGGLVVWENLEKAEPRHMCAVSRQKVLDLWRDLSAGRLREIDAEPWVEGYGTKE